MVLGLSLSEEIAGAPGVFLERETEAEFREMRGSITGTLGREGTDVMVDVTVSYETPLTCVRCLESFLRKGEVGERTLFFHEKNATADLLERYGPDGWVDLGPWVRELVLTDLPFYPLCDENCKGLCPECGENRNTGRCSCSPEE
ncbi:MAG: DUF177 domain-containing protein [Nitrospirae bacterium]|nr:DUF177 domain-containing protein [Nitrospirota bacterium]